MKPVHESGLGSTQQYFSCILQSHSSPFLYFFVLFLYFPVFAQISKRKKNKGVYTPELTNMTGWKITMFNTKYTSSFMVGFPLPAMWAGLWGEKNGFAKKKDAHFDKYVKQQGFFTTRHPQGFGVYSPEN